MSKNFIDEFLNKIVFSPDNKYSCKIGIRYFLLSIQEKYFLLALYYESCKISGVKPKVNWIEKFDGLYIRQSDFFDIVIEIADNICQFNYVLPMNLNYIGQLKTFSKS